MSLIRAFTKYPSKGLININYLKHQQYQISNKLKDLKIKQKNLEIYHNKNKFLPKDFIYKNPNQIESIRRKMIHENNMRIIKNNLQQSFDSYLHKYNELGNTIQKS